MPVLVAVGCSSSLGRLALERFLGRVPGDALPAAPPRWRIYAGYRGETLPPAGWDDPTASSVEWVPLDLESLESVNQFATAVSDREHHVDVLLLNAATWDATRRLVPLGTREAVVNYLAQHYLIHLLADKLAPSQPPPAEEGIDRLERARIVITTSNLHKSIQSLDQIPLFLRLSNSTPPPESASAASSADKPPPDGNGDGNDTPPSTSTSKTATAQQRYAASKAAQLLMAFYWRRHFADLESESGTTPPPGVVNGDDEAHPRADQVAAALAAASSSTTGTAATTESRRRRKRTRPVDVVAVSPGFVPATNLSRDSHWLARWFMRYVVSWAPFAVSVEEGAARIARCLPQLPPSPSQLRRDDLGQSPDPDSELNSPDSSSPSLSREDGPMLDALADAVGPNQIVYLSLASSEAFPSPLTVGQEGSSPGPAAVVVTGGAVGTWAERGAQWDEVERLGIFLPSTTTTASWSELDRLALRGQESTAISSELVD